MDKQHYSGISNASGAIALDGQHFMVGDDEDNLLSIYAQDVTDQAMQTIRLSTVFNGEIKDGKDHEIDLEGAAVIDDVYFWIGSHSTSRKGKSRPDRHRLLAIAIKPNGNGQFTVIRFGSIYNRLIADLKKDSRFQVYQLGKAEEIAPKDIGGLSIEGLASTPEKGLLVGFRNPLAGGQVIDGRLVQGKALLISLLNPFEVLAGHLAQFGDPIELDLGGLAIRDIAWYKNQQYLIVAGPYHDNSKNPESSRLYLWDKSAGKLDALDVDLAGLNVEAAFFCPGQDCTVQLLSDDGDRVGFHKMQVRL